MCEIQPGWNISWTRFFPMFYIHIIYTYIYIYIHNYIIFIIEWASAGYRRPPFLLGGGGGLEHAWKVGSETAKKVGASWWADLQPWRPHPDFFKVCDMSCSVYVNAGVVGAQTRRYPHNCLACQTVVWSWQLVGRIRAAHSTPSGQECPKQSWQVGDQKQRKKK